MDDRLATELNLVPTNRKLMMMADGTSVEVQGYMARLKVDGPEYDQIVEVFGVKMKTPSRQVLLGRSFLRDYWVTYHGDEERFYYYKHSHQFDFVTDE